MKRYVPLIIFLTLCFWLVNANVDSWFSTSTPTKLLSALSYPPESPKPKVLSSRVEFNPLSGNALIYGEVQNISAQSLSNIKIITSVYDKNDQFLKSAHGYAEISPLLPNQISPFTILIVSHQNFAAYKLDIE